MDTHMLETSSYEEMFLHSQTYIEIVIMLNSVYMYTAFGAIKKF